MCSGTLISIPNSPQEYKFSRFNRCGSAVRTKKLVKKLENLGQSVSLKHSIVVFTELRSADRFSKDVSIYVAVEGIVCFCFSELQIPHCISKFLFFFYTRRKQ